MVGHEDDDGSRIDKANAPNGGRKGGPREPRQRGRAESARKPPPAGPHADPSLTNEEATPGAGTLPPPDGEPNGGGSVSS